MRLQRVHLVLALATVTAFAACTLNPQPLPPGDPPDDNGATTFLDSGSFNNASDATARNPNEQDPADAAAASDDSGPAPPPSDGGLTDADAGDADAGDADASLPN